MTGLHITTTKDVVMSLRCRPVIAENQVVAASESGPRATFVALEYKTASYFSRHAICSYIIRSTRNISVYLANR